MMQDLISKILLISAELQVKISGGENLLRPEGWAGEWLSGE
jgi:hypothetical protein